MASLADKAIREIEAGLELQVQLDQEVYPDHQERMVKLEKKVNRELLAHRVQLEREVCPESLDYQGLRDILDFRVLRVQKEKLEMPVKKVKLEQLVPTGLLDLQVRLVLEVNVVEKALLALQAGEESMELLDHLENLGNIPKKAFLLYLSEHHF